VAQKILIVEEREIVREGLKAILKQDKRVSDIYEATSQQEVQEHTSNEADLVIIHQSLIFDITLLPAGKCILLVDKPDMWMLRSAFEHQARGYISENIASDLLLTMLATPRPYQERFLLDPVFLPWLMRRLSDNEQYTDEVSLLSPREREIYHLLQEGLERRSIARQLHIAESTLKTHIKNISRKKEKRHWAQEISAYKRHLK
jgi:DNA-binding NarL/FixJ family response regulator